MYVSTRKTKTLLILTATPYIYIPLITNKYLKKKQQTFGVLPIRYTGRYLPLLLLAHGDAPRGAVQDRRRGRGRPPGDLLVDAEPGRLHGVHLGVHQANDALLGAGIEGRPLLRGRVANELRGTLTKATVREKGRKK